MGPKVIDVYAGVGGISLGACRAGFHLSAAVEWDGVAIATHAKNFPRSKHFQADVSKLHGKDLLEQTGLALGELAGLVGGPPCQGFSVMGKRRPGDLRNNLFWDFFRLIAETQPKFFLAENVPGILDPRFDPLRQAAFALIQRKYHILKPIVLTASEFGAPTTRKRVFFIGYLPSAFRGDLSEKDFRPTRNVTSVYVREALAGLPTYVSPGWQEEAAGYRKLRETPQTEFLRKATNAVPKGVGDPNILSMLLEKDIVTGCLGTAHRPDVVRRFARLKPGQQDKIGKMVRLDPNGFCPTIRAGTTEDHGNFQSLRPVHHSQPRVITPREGARLQTFPDWFAFHATKYHSFRQIGNSVPPQLAERLLTVIQKALS